MRSALLGAVTALAPADYKRMLDVLDDVRGAVGMAQFCERTRAALSKHFGWPDATVLFFRRVAGRPGLGASTVESADGAGAGSRDGDTLKLVVALADQGGDRLLVIVPLTGSGAAATSRQQAILEMLGRQLAPVARDVASARAPSPRPSLTPRETQVAELLAAGLSNDQIAARMDITVSTVKKHVTRVLAKSGCDTRMQFTVFWLRPADAAAASDG